MAVLGGNLAVIDGLPSQDCAVKVLLQLFLQNYWIISANNSFELIPKFLGNASIANLGYSVDTKSTVLKSLQF